MLTRKRPTPGTPMAKSASLVSMNSLSWRGCMICSARALRSWGVSGGSSSCSSSPATRTVGARPTLSSRSEPFLSTMFLMAFWKKAVDAFPPGPGGGPALAGVAGAWIGSDIGFHPEEDLSEFHGRGVFDRHFADRAAHFRFDLVHDLHRLDDAQRLAGRDAAAALHVGTGAGLGRAVEGPHHGRLDLDQVALLLGG